MNKNQIDDKSGATLMAMIAAIAIAGKIDPIKAANEFGKTENIEWLKKFSIRSASVILKNIGKRELKKK